MRFTLFIAVVAALALSARVEAVDPEGFGDMSFGMPKDLAKKKLETEYNMRRKFPLPGAALVCRDGIELSEKEDRLYLEGYPYGSGKYRVTLYFNRNGKFYGYMLEGAPYGEGEVEGLLRDEVVALSKDFQQRYGPAGTKLRIAFQGVKERAETHFPIREDENFTVVTGVARRKAQWGNGTNLVAMVVVCDKQLRGEPKQAEMEDAQASAEEPRKRGRRGR